MSADPVGLDSGGLGDAQFRRLHQGTTIRRAASLAIDDRIRQVWVRRDVLRMLTGRELRQKYSSSVLGYAWSLIEPGMLIVTYYLLFKILHRSYPKYPLFVGCTILSWQWFHATVMASLSALRSNAKLITSVNLPREIYPLADVGARAIEYGLSLPILFVVALIYSTKPSGYIALLPVAIVLELMICTGMALIISSLNTLLRDVQRGIGIVLRLMFYLVPVLYPLTRLPSTIRRFDAINPIVGILEIQRAVWFPGGWTGWQPVKYSVIGSFAVLIAGVLIFARLERTVLKEL